MAGSGQQIVDGLDLTQVLSTAGRVSSFDPAAVDQLVSNIDRMHAEVTDDTCTVAPEIEMLCALVGAVRTLADVCDALQRRTEPVQRVPTLLVAAMNAFDQAGVDRLCPGVLRAILAQHEPPYEASVKALQRRARCLQRPLAQQQVGVEVLPADRRPTSDGHRGHARATTPVAGRGPRVLPAN